jgi:hypothetical protein
MDNAQGCYNCVHLVLNTLAGIKSGIVWNAYTTYESTKISRLYKRYITRRSPLKDKRRFGGTYFLHLQQADLAFCLFHVSSFLPSFLQNVG